LVRKNATQRYLRADFLEKKIMKKIILLLLATAALSVHAATPVITTSLDTTLLPNTKYNVSANIATDDAAALLALLAGGDNPLQIVDDVGNVLGQADVSELTDFLSGLVGSASHTVEFTVDNLGDTATNVFQRVLDTPGVTVSNVAIAPASDNPPTVRITQRHQAKLALQLRGTATDDRQVTRVEVTINGKKHRAIGTNNWHIRARLHEGANRIVVRAVDNAQHMSSPKRLTVRARK
jgi:hypothetical protein